MSNTAKSLFLASCGGTLSTEEKRRIFALIREDWTDDASEGIRASMLALLGLIQPLEGVPEWLLSLADRQRDPTYAEVLRNCATCPRGRQPSDRRRRPVERSKDRHETARRILAGHHSPGER
ncbi:hypothetical protein [Nannocystis pusilla]|uniref:hypothetical protein n=1 Tax=Nannocystis pusilla TaxID=889268 RepID=UPI003B7654C5